MLIYLSKLIGTAAVGLSARKIYDYIWRKINNYPPGPTGLPFFGNLFDIVDTKYYQHLFNAYGSVCMVQLGYRAQCIVINDINLAKKAMALPKFSFHSEEDHHGKRIPQTKGEKARDTGMNYKERRQMLQKGFISMLNSNYLSTIGCKHWEKQMYPVLDNLNNKSILLLDYIQYATFAMIFTSIFGEYVALPTMDSDEFNKHKSIWDDIVDDFFKRKLFELGLKPFYKMKQPESADKLWPLIWKWVERFDENKEKLEFADNEYQYDEKPLIFELREKYDKKVAMQELATIFIAAITTTKVTLNAAIVTLAKYKGIQQRLYDEVRTFTAGNDGVYELKSLIKLSYLRAVVHETLRYAGSTFNIPRVVLHSDVKLLDYNIPKGAVVIDAYRNFSMDRKFWKNPSVFTPENHLDENGMFKKQKAFCGFGMGKRDCPGLNEMEINP